MMQTNGPGSAAAFGLILAACILGVNVICIVLACGAFGAVRTLVKKSREGRA